MLPEDVCHVTCYSNCTAARNAGCCSSYYTCSECKTSCCNRSAEAQTELLDKFGHIDGFKPAFEAWQAELNAEEEKKKEGTEEMPAETANKLAEDGSHDCPNKADDANILFRTLSKKMETMQATMEAMQEELDTLKKRRRKG